MNINAVGMNSAVTAAALGTAVDQMPEAAPHTQAATRSPAEQEKNLQQMLVEMQEQMSKMNVGLEFSTYGEGGKKIAIVVTDKQTGEVIREIPTKEIQELFATMTELSGMLFNKQG